MQLVIKNLESGTIGKKRYFPPESGNVDTNAIVLDDLIIFVITLCLSLYNNNTSVLVLYIILLLAFYFIYG